VQKAAYNPDDAEEFERAWLLLANIHVGAGKYDLAEECCSKCLKYNRSCARAWELKGMILEKEASFQTAAECYQQAWELGHHVRCPWSLPGLCFTCV
jgi:tetratricopeptide repeat protein 21B